MTRRASFAAPLGLAAALVLASPAAAAPPALEDVTAASGLDFVHDHGGTGRKYLPEIMGSGGAALDFDGDGWLDLYFVQSGPLPGAGGTPLRNRLFRNLGGGRFAEVPGAAGAADTGYGMGAVAGDVDNDGDTDLYVVNFGPDRLYLNRGDGTFHDATEAAGIESPLWGSSAALLDADLDGRLDLYVVNYLDFTLETHVDCGEPSRGLFSYCHPDVYPMAPDVFFHNRGGGRFEEATRAAGLVDPDGKGLGAVAADFTGDGRPDLYVANDSTPNFLFRNLGGGRFAEEGLFLGVGYSEDGRTEAGMGVAAGDADRDGRLDLVVTNLSREANALYLGGPESFRYATRETGLYGPSYLLVGFGTDLVDFDNDGDLDLLVANGHVIDDIERIDDALAFRQPTQLFWNDGTGSFRPADGAAIADLSVPRVGRGTIPLDADRDGRVDVAITFNHDRARLFRNAIPGGAWIAFQLEGGGGGNRDGVGARVRVTSAAGTLEEERTAGSGYQTREDPTLHFGLGAAGTADRVGVRWPGGRRVLYASLPAGRFYRLYAAPAPGSDHR